MTQAAHATLERFLSGTDIPHKRIGDDRWALQLRGEHKLTIPVVIQVADERLNVQSFFMRRPQEDHARFYELLLRRNMRAYGIAFAIDPEGDVYLAGSRATEGFDERECDRLLGAILVEADGMFDAAIQIGFASYLARDMQWREKVARAADAAP